MRGWNSISTWRSNSMKGGTFPNEGRCVAGRGAAGACGGGRLAKCHQPSVAGLWHLRTGYQVPFATAIDKTTTTIIVFVAKVQPYFEVRMSRLTLVLNPPQKRYVLGREALLNLGPAKPPLDFPETRKRPTSPRTTFSLCYPNLRTKTRLREDKEHYP